MIGKLLASGVALLALSGAVRADCASDRIRSCFASEAAKPASSRGGVSASEFCAAEAIAACAAGGSATRMAPIREEADERARSQFRNTAPVQAPQPAPKAAAPVPAKREGQLTEIPVHNGVLRIVAGDAWDVKSSIRYNDNLIHEFENVFFGITAILFVGGDAVLLYSTNPGGSGTLNAHALVSIGQNGKIYETDLPGGTYGYTYTVGEDRISFDLGRHDGKDVSAIYANGRLDATYKAVAKTGLKAQDCDYLYNAVMQSCADEGGKSSCQYDDMGLPMAYQRPVNLLAVDEPNFRVADFKGACEQACRTKRRPAFASFRKAVCSPR